jgi:hypothetical protein
MIREYLAGPVTLRSVLVVVLLVSSVTAVNVLMNPPQPQVETDAPEMWFYEYIESLTFDNYTLFDIDYWYPEGMTVEELTLEGEGNTYNEGGLHGYADPNVPTGEFFFVWRPSGHFDDWTEALDYIMQTTGGDIVYDERTFREGESSRMGHPWVYTVLNGTSPIADEYVGTFYWQECTDTGRVLVYLYMNLEDYDLADYRRNGEVYLTYSCHPTQDTPIEDFIS